MNWNRTRKWTGLLLSGAVLSSLLVTSSLAAGSDASLEFQYPEDVDPAEVTLTVYEGYPASSGEDAVTALPQVSQNSDGSFVLSEPGTYCYWVRGDGYYNVCKIFNVTQEDLADGTVEMTVETGKMAYTGYEPTAPNLTNVPAGYAQGAADTVLILWPDEILEHFTTDSLANYSEYDTPFFTEERADHEFTSQEEMMDYLEAKDAAEADMYLYHLVMTPAYQ